MKKELNWEAYGQIARQAIAEGCVLLENRKQALPLQENTEIALFGRMQNHYYKSGTGSGGMVNVVHVVSIPDALAESGKVKMNEKLVSFYEEWEKENPFDEGIGWGQEPWSQKEAIVPDNLMKEVSNEAQTAVVIIARTAGEDKDNKDEEGSYRLTKNEENLLTQVREHFSTMIVLLNVGNIMDMRFFESVPPEALLYVWQGGMYGGYGVADILTGVTTPSGRLTDTIAYEITDYPSSLNFGTGTEDIYEEDIYVGYRYFETFAQEKVRYPFGYGLSYTSFTQKVTSFTRNREGMKLQVCVQNVGEIKGKDVIQVYMQAPQGNLGKAKFVLVGFAKTEELLPSTEERLEIMVPYEAMASFDDLGVTGNKNCELLEAGEYHFYLGRDAKHLEEAYSFYQVGDLVLNELSDACAPVKFFQRFRPQKDRDGKLILGREPVALLETNRTERIERNQPQEIAQTGDCGYTLLDLRNGKITEEEFVAQFSDEDLSCIIRGEGMGSPKVTPGTAAAFGGISNTLKNYGIPCVCCSDGPSGMRLDSGTKAFSLPNGTLLACTFNEEINERLFEQLGLEMISNRVDVLLGPGINIHRHPLNGRNFEYFSEDPLLTGRMAIAQLKGLKHAGVSGTLKHFCGNNRETKRHEMNSVISQRALREIYLKAFEMAVRAKVSDSVMTTYGAVNGLWTAGNYDLNTQILRKEWGFEGILMSDWWANINREGEKPCQNDFATMAMSQNDLYMVCPEADVNSSNDNTLETLAHKKELRAQLQRNACNICRFTMNTQAFARMNQEAIQVEVIGKPGMEEETNDEVIYYEVSENFEIDLSEVDTSKGKSFVCALDIQKKGVYALELTATSDLSPLAQIPVTVFYQSIPVMVFTFNGTNGKEQSLSRKLCFVNRYAVYRLFFGQAGLKLKSMKLTYCGTVEEAAQMEDCFLDWN